MSGYGSRRATRVNLVIGVGLVLLSILSLVSVVTSSVSGANLAGSAIFILGLTFLGGYEIGKYVENRISKQQKSNNNFQ